MLYSGKWLKLFFMNTNFSFQNAEDASFQPFIVSSFNCYDLRVGGDSPVLRNTKAHSMGVTAMLSSRREQHQLITGGIRS
jgi:hypothetical protein